MAKKRMFSLQIVDTDAFLDMPLSTQALYFHLVMRADDEGFISNPKRIMRLIGCQDDDLKILIGKRFILTFESGVVVIKHWLIHNTIRMDRFNETVYLEEKNSIKVKENGGYTENGNQMATIGKHKLSKVKLSKVKLDNNITQATPDEHKDIIQVMDIFRDINPTLNYGNKTTRNSCIELIKKFGLEGVKKFATYAVSIQGKDYAPTITTPYQLKEKLAQLKIYADKSNQSKIQSL